MTGGTHAGVMKHVGEAVKDFGVASMSKNPIISIGIAPWGCIQNKAALIEDQVKFIINFGFTYYFEQELQIPHLKL